MSVRAYRVNKIDKEKEPSFNLWDNLKLVDFLSLECDNFLLDESGGGLVEIPVEVMKKAIKKSKELEIEDYLEELKADVEWADKKGSHYLLYSCF